MLNYRLQCLGCVCPKPLEEQTVTSADSTQYYRKALFATDSLQNCAE